MTPKSLPASILLLALSYFVTGHLGLLLAIPPGYATAVWPASGIALAALLLYGYRLWPGVLLGSLLVNLDGSLHGSTPLTFVNSLTLGVSVGIGASLQALLGAFLINRYIDTKSGLVRASNVLGFLGLGGPVSCLVNSTWGVSTLWMFKLISDAEFPFSWMNWWVGDTFGVVVFLPLIYVWFGRPAEIWRWRKLPLALPLVLVLAMVIAFFVVASSAEQKRIEAEYRERAVIIGDSLEKQLMSYLEVLYAIQGLFLTTDNIDKHKFRKFVSRSLERIPVIQALSWNPVISQRQRSAFEASMQQSGYSQFQITERNDNGHLVRAGSKPNYVVVQYIEPYESNKKALGYDVYSGQTRKEALDNARVSGNPVTTARINLVQETGHQAGVLVFLPIYRTGVSPTGIEDRRKILRGYVVGAFRMGDVLETAMRDLSIAHTETRLIDETATEQADVLAVYPVSGNGEGRLLSTNTVEPSQNTLSWSTTYDIGGRSWRLLIIATPQYLTENRSWWAWVVLAGGLVLTGLLGTFLLILTGRAIVDEQRAKDLVKVNVNLNTEIAQREKAERSLRHANERLEILATVDNLTGAYNRRYIHDYGKRCDAELRRYHHPYSIIMCDVDNFKQINDRFGHNVGDAVLQLISQKVTDTLRETDCFGRWGGEEFIVVAKQTELDECLEFAQRLCSIINHTPVEPVGEISISLGVACNTGSYTLEEVIKKADQAMYNAKDNGRNRVEYTS